MYCTVSYRWWFDLHDVRFEDMFQPNFKMTWLDNQAGFAYSKNKSSLLALRTHPIFL